MIFAIPIRTMYSLFRRGINIRDLEKEWKKCHLQGKDNIIMVGLKIVGLESVKYTGISFIYNFRCDPDLEIDKSACRLTCLEMENNIGILI